MNENKIRERKLHSMYMYISADGTVVTISASKFLVIMKTVMKYCWGLLFGTTVLSVGSVCDSDIDVHVYLLDGLCGYFKLSVRFLSAIVYYVIFCFFSYL